jgi:outer membrane protein TolC
VTAQAALNTVLGLSIDTSYKVTGRLVERRFDIESQSELIKLAISSRPDFASASLALKSNEERTKGARREYLPKFDLFGTVGVSGKNLAQVSSDYTIGASITFNLFDAGRSARLRQARAAESRAAAEQESLASRIRLEVVRAYQQYVSARERLNVAVRVVDQAQETLRIVRDRYQEGLTTITEVLRAETTLVRAQITLLTSRYDQYIGYGSLLLATGRLHDVQPFVS